uniref:Uncharacterized protein n=1 Tax=viral metagenome TaxID=1070528 RepID=A0A2V0R9R0_9ZZZZ
MKLGKFPKWSMIKKTLKKLWDEDESEAPVDQYAFSVSVHGIAGAVHMMFDGEKTMTLADLEFHIPSIGVGMELSEDPIVGGIKEDLYCYSKLFLDADSERALVTLGFLPPLNKVAELHRVYYNRDLVFRFVVHNNIIHILAPNEQVTDE